MESEKVFDIDFWLLYVNTQLCTHMFVHAQTHKNGQIGATHFQDSSLIQRTVTLILNKICLPLRKRVEMTGEWGFPRVAGHRF